MGIPVGTGWEWEFKIYTYRNPGLTAPTYNNVLQIPQSVIEQDNENSIRLLFAMNGLNTER